MKYEVFTNTITLNVKEVSKKIICYSGLILLLASCSTVNKFSQRKYMPGYNFDPVKSFTQPFTNEKETVTSFRQNADSLKKPTVRDTTKKIVVQQYRNLAGTFKEKDLRKEIKPYEQVPVRNDGWKSPMPSRTVTRVPADSSDNPFPLIKAPKPVAVLSGFAGTGLAAYSFYLLLALFEPYGFVLGLAAVLICGLFYGYTDIKNAPLLTVLCYITLGFGLLELILLAIVGAGSGGN